MKNRFNSAKLSAAPRLWGVAVLAACAMLLALEVVLGMFTLNVSPVLKIGFSFLPVAAAGMLFGPVAGGTVGALGDVVSYFISTTGPYFPGFTVNGFLSGFLYGLFLYKKPATLLRSFLAKASVTLLVNLLLTPLWLAVLYSRAFVAVFSARVAANLALLPIDVALLYVLLKGMEKEPFFHLRK